MLSHDEDVGTHYLLSVGTNRVGGGVARIFMAQGWSLN